MFLICSEVKLRNSSYFSAFFDKFVSLISERSTSANKASTENHIFNSTVFEFSVRSKIEGDISCAFKDAIVIKKKMTTIKNNLLVLFKLKFSILIICFGFFVSKGLPSISHEMWLDTTTFQQSVGKDIQISLKNGQMFKGIGLS